MNNCFQLFIPYYASMYLWSSMSDERGLFIPCRWRKTYNLMSFIYHLFENHSKSLKQTPLQPNIWPNVIFNRYFILLSTRVILTNLNFYVVLEEEIKPMIRISITDDLHETLNKSWFSLDLETSRSRS